VTCLFGSGLFATVCLAMICLAAVDIANTVPDHDELRVHAFKFIGFYSAVSGFHSLRW
jgi:hypothetical protein